MIVMPANAGIQETAAHHWIPAFAGMTTAGVKHQLSRRTWYHPVMLSLRGSEAGRGLRPGRHGERYWLISIFTFFTSPTVSPDQFTL